MKSLIVLICIFGVKSWEIVIKGTSSVQIGTTLSLTCDATNLTSPPTSVVWYKDYNKTLPNERTTVTMLKSPKAITSKLTITDVGRNDAGKYKCWVSNEIISHFTVAVVDKAKSGGVSTHYSAISLSFTAFSYLLQTLNQF